MSFSDLYTTRINLEPYFSIQQCRNCGADNCKSLVDKLKKNPDLNLSGAISQQMANALHAWKRAEKNLPKIPKSEYPTPGESGFWSINNAGADAPVLITGNNKYTQELMMVCLAEVEQPYHILYSDTNGDTVDMALILGTFTAERIIPAVEEVSATHNLNSPIILLPGLAEKLKTGLKSRLKNDVMVGPVCAAELPLWFYKTLKR